MDGWMDAEGFIEAFIRLLLQMVLMRAARVASWGLLGGRGGVCGRAGGQAGVPSRRESGRSGRWSSTGVSVSENQSAAQAGGQGRKGDWEGIGKGKCQLGASWPCRASAAFQTRPQQHQHHQQPTAIANSQQPTAKTNERTSGC